MSRAHKGGNGQDVVNRGPSRTGKEGATGLSPNDEPLILQIYHQATQEGDNTKEAQQDQKTPPLCRLNIWNVPQEAMENQIQALKWINQETLGDQTRVHDLNLPDGLCPTRVHPPSHWGSNPL